MQNSFKIDLHTHSIISHDGGIKMHEYQELLESGTINYIAITDHNEIEFAQEAYQKFGNKIIVGEEVMTTHGEIIGLFLTEKIPALLSPQETIQGIKKQNGLVYIPHPFETFRSGIQQDILESIIDSVDIIEIFNARSLQRHKANALKPFIAQHNSTTAASSDAHGKKGVGYGYSIIDNVPTRENLVQLLQSGEIHIQYAPLITLLYPKLNKLKKKLHYV